MRHFSLVLLVIFAFCFFGCQSSNDSNYNPPNEPPADNPPNEPPADNPPNEPPVDIPPNEPPVDNPPNEPPVDVPPADTPREIVGEGHFFLEQGELRNFPQDRYIDPNLDPWQDPWWNSNGVIGPVILLSSEEEVHELLGETYSVSSRERDDRFENIIKKYDYGFFENNQVLAFLFSANGIERFELNNIIYQDDILTVELGLSVKSMGARTKWRWFALVEIEKISAETQIQVEFIRNYEQGYTISFIETDFGGPGFYNHNNRNVLEVVQGFDELQTILYDDCMASDFLRTYDADFFDDNVLIVVSHIDSPGDLSIVNIELENEVFRIVLNHTYDIFGTYYRWIVVIEVGKSEINDARRIELFRGNNEPIGPLGEPVLIAYIGMG